METVFGDKAPLNIIQDSNLLSQRIETDYHSISELLLLRSWLMLLKEYPISVKQKL